MFIGISAKQPPAIKEGLHLSRVGSHSGMSVETAEWRQSLSDSDKGG